MFSVCSECFRTAWVTESNVFEVWLPSARWVRLKACCRHSLCAFQQVLDPQKGKLVRLRPHHVAHLTRAIAAFKRKFGIANEAYHYTPYAERMQTDAFVGRGVCCAVLPASNAVVL